MFFELLSLEVFFFVVSKLPQTFSDLISVKLLVALSSSTLFQSIIIEIKWQKGTYIGLTFLVRLKFGIKRI